MERKDFLRNLTRIYLDAKWILGIFPEAKRVLRINLNGNWTLGIFLEDKVTLESMWKLIGRLESLWKSKDC